MNDTSQPVLTTRRALPSGRAVLGALLVTLAALGVLLATRLGDDAMYQNVVVATRELTPGTVVSEADVALVRLRLDEEATWVLTDTADAIGNVLVGPVGRLEFLQASNVVSGNPGSLPSGLAEVSVEIDPTRAPAQLAAGEVVSILATFEESDGTDTELIADRVVVLSYRNGDGDLTSGDTVLRLGVSDGAIASEIVMAAEVGEVSVIGVTDAPEVTIPEVVSR